MHAKIPKKTLQNASVSHAKSQGFDCIMCPALLWGLCPAGASVLGPLPSTGARPWVKKLKMTFGIAAGAMDQAEEKAEK